MLACVGSHFLLTHGSRSFSAAALLTSDSFDGVRRPNRTLLGVNYIVGPVRYGVVRVNKESCPSAPAFVSVRVALNAAASATSVGCGR